MLALIATLAGTYHLTQDKIRRLLSEVIGITFSLGAISQAQGKIAHALQHSVTELKNAVAQVPVRHVHETSHSHHAQTYWVWAMATEQACYFTILPTRGQYGAEDLLGGQPSGIVVSDRYASYNFIPVAHRQVCWAHLLRHFALRWNGLP